MLPRAIHRFNEISIKIPMAFFHINRTNNPIMCTEPKMTQIAKTVLGKTNKAECFMLFDLKLYYKAKAIKTI